MKSLSVSGTLDSLKIIADYVIEAAKSAGLDKKSTYKLRLAVDEVATNIITHGYEEANLSGKLDLLADINDSALTLSVEDTGARYDPYEQVQRGRGRIPQAFRRTCYRWIGSISSNSRCR